MASTACKPTRKPVPGDESMPVRHERNDGHRLLSSLVERWNWFKQSAEQIVTVSPESSPADSTFLFDILRRTKRGRSIDLPRFLCPSPFHTITARSRKFGSAGAASRLRCLYSTGPVGSRPRLCAVAAPRLNRATSTLTRRVVNSAIRYHKNSISHRRRPHRRGRRLRRSTTPDDRLTWRK